MPKLVTVAQMQAIEAAADALGVSYALMMARAGRATADLARQLLPSGAASRVLVLIGHGNNGGDGLVAARHLAEQGMSVTCYLARGRDDGLVEAARNAGATVLSENLDMLRQLAAEADLIVDALLGTGAKPPVRGTVREILLTVRRALDERIAQVKQATSYSLHELPEPTVPSRPRILAVDLPSGIDADSGELDAECTLRADATITFEAVKHGLLTASAAEYVGTLHVAPLDLPADLPELAAVRHYVIDSAKVAALLPRRPLDANKGTFGKVLILGGSERYIGAAGLAAQAAYRVGAGLVTVAAPKPVVSALAAALPEVTWLPLPNGNEEGERTLKDAAISLAMTEVPDYSAMLIGVGMGRALNAFTLIETVLTQAEGQLPPLVIDADGLNMLATMDEWWSKIPPNTILTPHPGEMARLAKLRAEDGRTPVQQVQADRLRLAAEKAAQWRCIVVLKGAFTVIASPEGDVAVLPFAEPALARAGTGDVLAGMTAGLLAQGLQPFEAAISAAYLHAVSGKLAAVPTRSSVLAQDVIAHVPHAIAALEKCRLAR
ncbi:MAG: NAD(P)H-hydrate dehydratase [Anaerolineae bacterium]|nr:NAD(P)H-hydrate dehydratase [Anaerolineae bacterium]MDW8299915.1 NAD(P)H-hydrate dehydratase [Anaerolineae bacterium]